MEISQKSQGKNQWVVFKLSDRQFALPVMVVKEMTRPGHITPIPDAPADVLGTMNLRDRVIPLVDLRVRLGIPSLAQEQDDLMNLLTAREEDHVLWLDELESCVQDKRPFRLARDPHQCAFGHWFDHFKTSDRILEGQIRKFDRPHQAIHAVADRVIGLLESEGIEAAQEAILMARNRELSEMVRIFSQTRDMIQERNLQIAIIMDIKGRLSGLIIDEVLAVSRISPDLIEPPVEVFGTDTTMMAGVARTMQNSKDLIFLLNPDQLF